MSVKHTQKVDGSLTVKYTQLFEKIICSFHRGKNIALQFSSCTAGASFIMYSLWFLKKGTRLLCPSMTHTATAHAIEFYWS